MSKIAILPEILCNQIAAGEVVERPAAVVKELVENSIDAQSTGISVSLLQGGRKEIRVVDNGCGMNPEDALLALERHATSKIRSVGDLNAIETLGFRGEAIPSIAAVSRFELTTRESGAVAGTTIKIEGGVLKDVRERGCPAGTQVVVRDLFYCLPARRKFLRTEETELAYIADLFLRIAMAHPEIHMQLFSRTGPSATSQNPKPSRKGPDRCLGSIFPGLSPRSNSNGTACVFPVFSHLPISRGRTHSTFFCS